MLVLFSLTVFSVCFDIVLLLDYIPSSPPDGPEPIHKQKHNISGSDICYEENEVNLSARDVLSEG